MTAFVRFYRENVAEGNNFLIFSVIFSVFIKTIYFLFSTQHVAEPEYIGYLWSPFIPFFENRLYSLVFSSIFIFFIAFLINSINTKHVLIKERTMLPSGIAILLFSCMPQQQFMSPYYVGVIAILLVIDSLFSCYNSTAKQMGAFSASFYLILGSLFSPILLMYLPILWVCLGMLRSLNLKSFLVTIFSFVLLYFPVFTYFLMTGNIEDFTKPFLQMYTTALKQIPLFGYGALNYVALGFAVLFVLIVLSDYFINNFKDKIRVRLFLHVLTVLSMLSLACTLLLNVETTMTLYITFVVAALQAGHFFALGIHRIVFIFFYLLLLFFVIICFFTI